MKKILVNPDMAKELLANQAANRTRSKTRTTYYSRLMSETKWLCHPALALHLNERGQLANGQHRLSAIIESGIAQWFYVDTLPDDVLDALHDIKHRSLADRLVMGEGWNGSDAKILASIGNALACRMETGALNVFDRIGFAMRSYTTEDLVAAFEWTCADPRELVLTVRRFYEQQPAKYRLFNPTLIGLVVCQRPHGWEEFLGELCMDSHPSRRESVLSLRRALGNQDYSPSTRMAMIACAYNDPTLKKIRIGKTVSDLMGGNWEGR